MLKKFLFFLLLFYALALIQTSFFTRFNIFGQVPNLILVALFLIIVFDVGTAEFFPFEAVLAGLFLDVFSHRFLGVSVFLLCLASILLQKTLKVVKRQNLIIPYVLFIAFSLFYESGILLFDYFINQIDFSGTGKIILVRVLYNLFFLALIYNLSSVFFNPRTKDSRFCRKLKNLCLIFKSPNGLKAKK